LIVFSLIGKAKDEILELFPEYAWVGADAFIEQNYFKERESAHTNVVEGQQHIAMANDKFIKITLS